MPIRINSKTGTVALQRYKLENVPLTIVAEPHGMEVFRLEGQANARKIAAFLEASLANAEEQETSFATLREAKTDAASHLALGRFYRRAGLTEQAATRHPAAMKTAEGAVWLDACAGAVTALVEDEQVKRARELLEQGLERAGEDPPPAAR